MAGKTTMGRALTWAQVERDSQLTLEQISQLTSGLTTKTHRNKGKGWEWLRKYDVPDGREHRWYAMSVLQDWVLELAESAIHSELVALLDKWTAQEERDG